LERCDPEISSNSSNSSSSKGLAQTMASVKRDAVKQSWETGTEFPLVCETCLGDNPYVRMTVEQHGKKCQVCENPFTVFAWQAGTKGRLKRVEICKTCAQAKNVCQVCIYDLQYGLPVKVRDKVLRETGSATSGAVAAIPQSHANRAWYTAQQQRAIADGETTGSETTALAHAKLQEMARMEPCYERNLPKLCSFFAKGECDRGANCPFRHEMPRDRNDPMSKQNTKDRFFGTNDPVANKIIGRKRQQERQQEQQIEQEGYDKARTTLYLRFAGEAPYPALSERNVRDAMYAFGEIVSVRVQPDKGQAFVEYTQPQAAELALASMQRTPLLDRTVMVAWARAVKRGEGGTSNTTTAMVPRYNNDSEPPRESKRRATHETSTTQSQPATAVAVSPVAPPTTAGANRKPLPSLLFAAVKPPPHVVAAAETMTKSSVGTSNSSKPYYPSADPGRLGTKAPPVP
jgi:pre-mRNA-splicing factor RBM22/SLT11